MNNTIIIALLLINFGTAYLYAQGQKNANQEDSPKNAALKKALIESEKTRQEYLISSSGSNTKRNIDSLLPHDNAQIQQLQRHGLKSAYDTLYSILLSGAVKKDSNILSYYGKILPDAAHTEYSYKPEYCRQIAWSITSAGYTLPMLEEFQSRGINVINYHRNWDRHNPWKYLTIFNPLIVVGRIDSAYIDTSLHDDSYISYNVSIKETLKGDTSLKKIIIRKSEISGSFGGRKGEEYLLFLNKNQYERISFLRADESNKRECTDCYHASSLSFILLPENRRVNYQHWEEGEQAVRVYCKEYAPIFKKMKQD
jgi:hypothetical protein